MTARVFRDCGSGHWYSLFTKLSETPIKVLTPKFTFLFTNRCLCINGEKIHV